MHDISLIQIKKAFLVFNPRHIPRQLKDPTEMTITTTSTQDLLNATLTNLKVANADVINARRDEITRALNKWFRDTESDSKNRLMVGSYGRRTAINGISDLDMIYILPNSKWEEYHKTGGTSKALQATKKAVLKRYPRTDVKVDRLVVVIQFEDFKFEIQPAFELEDHSFSFPDTYSDSWKITKPRLEIEAIKDLDDETSGNTRKLCKLTRAWKYKHSVNMSGLLIDSLVYRFLDSTDIYNSSNSPLGKMVHDFFAYLQSLDKQDYFMAPGSNQQVKVKSSFQTKAKEAQELCIKALNAEGKDYLPDKWKKVFGSSVPKRDSNGKAALNAYAHTEEFIENIFAVDLQFRITLDCTVIQKGFRPMLLSQMLRDGVWLRPQKSLCFFADLTGIPEPYEVWWKVLNRGDEAIRRNCIRGQIIKGNSKRRKNERIEHTDFQGAHYVQCYIVRYGVVVARGHIDVPIHP